MLQFEEKLFVHETTYRYVFVLTNFHELEFIYLCDRIRVHMNIFKCC